MSPVLGLVTLVLLVGYAALAPEASSLPPSNSGRRPGLVERLLSGAAEQRRLRQRLLDQLRTLTEEQQQEQAAERDLMQGMSPDLQVAHSVYRQAQEVLIRQLTPLLVSSALLIQQNIRAKESSNAFNRTWVDYKTGFGDESGDLWIGNELLHRLTAGINGHCMLRVDMQHQSLSQPFWADYSSFSVANESAGYQLNVSGFSGNVYVDALSLQNGTKFSTWDRDNDRSSSNCAASSGGFWHNSECDRCRINGKATADWKYLTSSSHHVLKTSRMWLLCSHSDSR